MFRKCLLTVSLLTFVSFIGCTDKNVNPIGENESNTSTLASAPQAFPGQAGVLDSGYFRGERIYYSHINGKNVFQGDIILADSVISKTSTLFKQQGAIRNSHLWPNNIIYYTINPDLHNPVRVTAAISHWMSNTNLVFVSRTTQANYIRFQQGTDNGCWSNSLGMLGGEQIISLSDWGTTGNVIHEIGHAVNHFHEQTRPDGDNINIKINWANIGHDPANDWWTQFYVYSTTNNDGVNNGNYDFNSIMHYSCYSNSLADGGCAIDPNLPVITKIDGTTWTVNRTYLSTGDIAASKALYPVRDIDGNVYATVKIGNQIWTVENLKTTRYNDGTSIPQVSDNTQWGNLTSPAFCYVDNNPANNGKYGKLYNSYAVATGKLAPVGWHVPTDAEWNELTTYLIDCGYNYDGTTTGNKQAKSLAAQTDWFSSTTTGAIGTGLSQNNRSGFLAYPGSLRYDNGTFGSSHANNTQVGKMGCWWSSDSPGITLSYNSAGVLNTYNYLRITGTKYGFSVRLVKNNY